MKFPVLWLASVSLSVWVGTEKGVRLAWDLMSRPRITLHLGAKAVKSFERETEGNSEGLLYSKQSGCALGQQASVYKVNSRNSLPNSGSSPMQGSQSEGRPFNIIVSILTSLKFRLARCKVTLRKTYLSFRKYRVYWELVLSEM